jgi:hypothetical protein
MNSKVGKIPPEHRVIIHKGKRIIVCCGHMCNLDGGEALEE